MVGTVKQQLYITGIPKGMRMRITALNLLPPDPAKEWRATLYGAGERQLYAPFDFDPSVGNGWLGEVKMYGAHAFPSNSLGARLEILWQLTGTPTRLADGAAAMDVPPEQCAHPATKETPDADDPAPSVDPNDPESWCTKLGDMPPYPTHAREVPLAAEEREITGRFIVETTKWGAVQRPDYAAVVYQIGAETPLRVVSNVPATIIGMPKDALFVIGIVDVATGKVGINGVQERAISDSLVSYLMQGIFFAHEKAFGWILGKFW